jgi:hypothetical protein
MATSGYDAGVIQDADGLLFVGTKLINKKAIEDWGLKPELRVDRGRESLFYLNPAGQALIKILYPGFAIILSRDFELARAVVKVSSEIRHEAVEPSASALGHAMYRPTSAMEQSGTASEDVMRFLQPGYNGPLEFAYEIWGEQAVDKTQELWFPSQENITDEFFYRMADIKGKVIFLDIIEEIRSRRDVKSKDLKKIRQIKKKRVQKIEELIYFTETMQPILDALPPEVTVIQDMAGGAGDLALAVGFYLLLKGHPLQQIQIIDPYSKRLGLDSFMERILDHLPFGEELRSLSVHTNEALQKAKILPNALVIAKHACGDLTDSIIEKWIRSDSVALGAMTCCQDKAATKSARYDIVAPDGFLVVNCHRCGAVNRLGDTLCVKASLPKEDKCVADPSQGSTYPHQATSQDYWEWLCLSSAKTNARDPETLAEGMEAMTILDRLRVRYLARYEFDVELFQNSNFPKGDIIVARK